jgi:hypothetical protein
MRAKSTEPRRQPLSAESGKAARRASLQTPSERLAFAMAIRDRDAHLIDQSVNHRVDVLGLLRTQSRVARRFPDQSHRAPVHIDLVTKRPAPVQRFKGVPGAVEDLARACEKAAAGLPRTINARAAAEPRILECVQRLLDGGEPSVLAIAIASSLAPHLREQVLSLPLEDKLRFFSGLDDGAFSVDAGTQKRFKLSPGEATKDGVLARLRSALSADEELFSSLGLYLGSTAGDQDDGASIAAAAVSVLQDPVLLERMLRELSADSPRARSLLAQRARAMLRRLFDIEVTTEMKVIRRLHLEDVPPELGIFEGTAGADCTTSTGSSVFANAPTERTYFIYDGDSLKGYIGSSIVEADGQRALYVHSIAGVHVSSEDTESMLLALHASREELGVDMIVLPSLESAKRNLNYRAVQDAVLRLIRGGRSVSLRYLDAQEREKIAELTDASRLYESPERNRAGVVFDPSRIERLMVEAVAGTGGVLVHSRRREVSPGEAMLYALHARSKRKNCTLEGALKAAGIKAKTLDRLEETLQNTKSAPIATLLENIGRELSRFGVTVDDRFILEQRRVLEGGWFRAPDAMEPSNQSTSMRYAIEALQKSEGSVEQFRAIRFVERHAAKLAADPDFSRFVRGLLGQNPDRLDLLLSLLRVGIPRSVISDDLARFREMSADPVEVRVLKAGVLIETEPDGLRFVEPLVRDLVTAGEALSEGARSRAMLALERVALQKRDEDEESVKRWIRMLLPSEAGAFFAAHYLSGAKLAEDPEGANLLDRILESEAPSYAMRALGPPFKVDPRIGAARMEGWLLALLALRDPRTDDELSSALSSAEIATLPQASHMLAEIVERRLAPPFNIINALLTDPWRDRGQTVDWLRSLARSHAGALAIARHLELRIGRQQAAGPLSQAEVVDAVGRTLAAAPRESPSNRAAIRTMKALSRSSGPAKR